MFELNGLILRLVEKKDLEILRKLRNDPSTWINLTSHNLISYRAQKKWYENLSSQKDTIYCVINDKKNKFIGSAHFYQIDNLNKSCGVGTNVLATFRGKGYGSKIYDIILEYGFNFLNMNRIWLQIIQSNRAKNLYLRKGFKIEGKLEKAVYRDGNYRDLISMRILKNEYKSKKSK